MIRRKCKKLGPTQLMPADYDGSYPLLYDQYEKAIQSLIKNPSQNYTELAKSFGHHPPWIYKFLKRPECKARHDFLQNKVADKVVLSRAKVIEGIMQETTGGKASDRLRAWELLGKTMALFTDRHQLIGLPKRIIIRTNSGTEQLVPEVLADAASSND